MGFANVVLRHQLLFWNAIESVELTRFGLSAFRTEPKSDTGRSNDYPFEINKSQLE
jgi:hypothetical protein